MALENDNPLLRKNYTPLLKATYYGKLVVIVVAFQLAASPYSAKLLKSPHTFPIRAFNHYIYRPVR